MYPSDTIQDPLKILPDTSTSRTNETNSTDDENNIYYLPYGGNKSNFTVRAKMKLDNEMNDDSDVDTITYQPGSYYKVIFKYTGLPDFEHTIYIYCVNVTINGSSSMTYSVNDKYDELGLTLYKFKQTGGDPLDRLLNNTQLPGSNAAPCDDIDGVMVSFEITPNTSDPNRDKELDCNGVIYYFDSNGIPRKKEEQEITLNEEGLQFLIIYDFPEIKEMKNFTRFIQVESTEFNNEKNAMLSKFKNLRHPYQFTAEKYDKMKSILDVIKTKSAELFDTDIILYNPEQDINKNLREEEGEKLHLLAGGSYNKNLAIINIDTTTFDKIKKLKENIDYIYKTIKLKTDYDYDSVKWLTFITKYITYHKPFGMISSDESEKKFWQREIYKIREELLKNFKRYNVSSAQKSELYSYDFFDSDFYKLIEFNHFKPLNSRSNIVLKMKKYFTLDSTGTNGFKDEADAKTEFDSIFGTTEGAFDFESKRNNSPVITPLHKKEEFGKLWNRKNDFKYKSSDGEYYQIEMMKDGMPEVFKDGVKLTDSNMDWYRLQWTNKGEGGNAIIKGGTLTFAVAASEQQDYTQSKNLLPFFKGEAKGARLSEHIINTLATTRFWEDNIIFEGWYGKTLKSEQELEKLGIGTMDRKGKGDNIMWGFLGQQLGDQVRKFGGKYTKTHKKKKTLKKRPSRKRR